ncbi:MAG TPA: chemotaxis protein CheX [Pilimelia sp.]|nr:chemotaxis protein CheX [Pilimelia sp.]
MSTDAAAPTAADLSEITEQVWTSYLDPDGEHPLLVAPPVAGPDDVFAAVSISGAWRGHVLVTCSPGAARHAAAAFLAMEPGEVGEDDIADVLGELVNIIGGNVKSMLPTGSFISLPHVTTNAGARTHFPSAVQVCELSGTWRGEHMSFSMWQSEGERAEVRAA